jgi:ribosomal protein L23
MEIAALLRSMYNIEADSINTINYEVRPRGGRRLLFRDLPASASCASPKKRCPSAPLSAASAAAAARRPQGQTPFLASNHWIRAAARLALAVARPRPKHRAPDLLSPPPHRHSRRRQGKKKRIFDPKGRPKWYRQTDWKKVYVTVKPPKQAAKAADAAQRNAVAAFERERLKSVESGVGRQRYELLPLAVRHALMERRDAARGEQGAARGEQGTAAAAGRGERGRGERGAAAARGGPAGKRQRGRRLGFVQRQDGQGVPETRDT